MVCELELKYGVNYIEACTFVHHQIPNLTYATAIATAFQVALQATITHHGIMPNNPDLVLTLINFLLNNSFLLPQIFSHHQCTNFC
jgi:hypothetical protein